MFLAVMLLKRFCLALLLAPAALATPVPGKEVAKRGGYSYYRPAASAICRQYGYRIALTNGRRCIPKSEIQFELTCADVNSSGRAILPGKRFIAECDPDYFCMDTMPRSLDEFPPNYNGPTSIACVAVGDETSAKSKKGDLNLQTGLTRRPPFPGGKMVGTLVISSSGGQGSAVMEWDYQSNLKSGFNVLGRRESANRFDIIKNYDHDAQFFGVARNLDPKYIYTLAAAITWFPTSPLKAREEEMGLEVRDEETEARAHERIRLEGRHLPDQEDRMEGVQRIRFIQ